MILQDDALEIDFAPKKTLSFTIEEPEGEGENSFYIEDTAEKVGLKNRGAILELADVEILSHIMENPASEFFFLYENLSDETKDYIADPADTDPSALIYFFQRAGYKYELLGREANPVLKVFTS